MTVDPQKDLVTVTRTMNVKGPVPYLNVKLKRTIGSFRRRKTTRKKKKAAAMLRRKRETPWEGLTVYKHG